MIAKTNHLRTWLQNFLLVVVYPCNATIIDPRVLAYLHGMATWDPSSSSQVAIDVASRLGATFISIACTPTTPHHAMHHACDPCRASLLLASSSTIMMNERCCCLINPLRSGRAARSICDKIRCPNLCMHASGHQSCSRPATDAIYASS